MNTLLNKSPLYLPQKGINSLATKDKGKQIMESLLLSQYQSSENLKEFFMAFISEMDFLFEQIEEVYLGRFLERAVGEQLDIIGIILQQPRAIILPDIWFGFSDNGTAGPNIDGMSNESTPAAGGLFRDENVETTITPLDDSIYRKVLTARAIVSNRETADLSLAYYVITTLLGRVPSVLELRDQDSAIPTPTRTVKLIVAIAEVTAQEELLIYYMTKYFVPAGITFTIDRI